MKLPRIRISTLMLLVVVVALAVALVVERRRADETSAALDEAARWARQGNALSREPSPDPLLAEPPWMRGR